VSSSDHKTPIFLAGPTAVGKSEIALRLAEHLGGEIISVDSMQVYRGLDIGTAKPSPAERQRITHHLIDVAELTEAFDAARFVTLARKAVGEITARRRVPIFCGGTGLYFKALLEGLGKAPPANITLRAELEATPLEKLLEELRERDLATFERIDQQNPRRVIRAVEVIRLTGKPFSTQRASWNSTPGIRGTELFFGLSRSANDLRHRIDVRVDEMFRHGLVDETRRLLERGLAQNQTALQAIGYRQVAEHLRGERPLSETIELVKIRTRQFAKRQLTWFKRHAAPAWIALSPNDEISRVVTQIANDLTDGGRQS
jgi:tRNA dimethylallyltransferase